MIAEEAAQRVRVPVDRGYDLRQGCVIRRPCFRSLALALGFGFRLGGLLRIDYACAHVRFSFAAYRLRQSHGSLRLGETSRQIYAD
jgi:hypothetical protein